MKQRKFFLPLIFFIFMVSASTAPGLQHDSWYTIKIGGKPVGYVHEELRLPTAGTKERQAEVLQTISEMRIILNRLGVRVEIRFFSSTDESIDGQLLRTDSEMTASNQTTKSKAEIKEGAIKLRNEAGGKTYARTLNYTGDLYGPEAIRKISATQLKNPGDKITVQTFVAEVSLVTKLLRTVLNKEALKIDGEDVATIKVEETLEGVPTKRTVWLDSQGEMVRQEEPGPFGAIEAIRSDKFTALTAASGQELPEEMYQSSIVRANIRLPRAKNIDRLKIKLTHKNPSLGWPDLNAPNQKVLERTEKTLVLEILRPEPAKGLSFPVAMTEQNRPYLMPNVYIQSDDLEIQRLAKELLGGEENIFQAALILERWVAENMKFDLGIVFAPAREIFRDRRGTCVGYATLLATLARAADIPSRIVMGYVYALGMFGGRAWTEVLAGERWIPLDAAIVNEGAADATRFYFVASSLADGLGELVLGSAQQVFGQIAIDIIEYETAGNTHIVPPGAKSFLTEGDQYENPWLGIKIKKPADFRFAKLDAVWPDPTVLELEGPAAAKAALEQHEIYPWQEARKAAREKLAKIVPEGREEIITVNGNEVIIRVSADGQKAAAAVARGFEVFIWSVEGKDSPKFLRQIASVFKLDLF